MNGKINYGAGAIAGIAGGVVFGLMMSMMGMMPMIAGLVKSQSAGVGWVVHLFISLIIGLFFAWWFGKLSTTFGAGAGYGLLHGFIWWILGPLLIMPVLMGMGPQFANMFAKMNMISLMGHLIFGLILGLVYVAVAAKSGAGAVRQS